MASAQVGTPNRVRHSRDVSDLQERKVSEHLSAKSTPGSPIMSNAFSPRSTTGLPLKTGVYSDEDLHCGWLSFNPPALQRFMTPEWVLTSFCLASFIQGMVISGFVNVALPVLERRFRLRSIETGLIVSMYNLGSLMLMAPITYFGGNRHKPKIMSIGTACMGVGSLIFALPHFLAPQYKFSKAAKDTCPYEGPDVSDVADYSHLRSYRFILMVANMIHGCATVPFYTLAIAYMDDNLTTRKSSRYIGTYYTLAIIGPAVGFILGGYLLNTYTDITVDASSLGLTPSSNVWVGAWWLGFVLAAFLAFCASIPIAAFPRRLPGTAHIESEKRIEVDERRLSLGMEGREVISLNEMPKAAAYLLRNYTFVFISLAATVETMIGSGLSNFGTKLFESQFGMSSSSAGGMIGLIAIPSACLGAFLGGYVVSKLDLTCASIIRMCVYVSMATWVSLLLFAAHCPNLEYAGVEVQNGMNIPVAMNCSSNCSCPQEFNPVCGKDRKMYLSPCIAGCRNGSILENVNVYSDCDCIKTEDAEHLQNSTMLVEAERVKCRIECFAFFLYLVASFFSLFATFYISTPGISATIRCVTSQQKSFALGVQWTCIRLLGTIPAPLIFGKGVDLACSMWSSDDPEDAGNCLLYDNASLSFNFSSILLALKALSVLLFACASMSYRPPPPTDPSSPPRLIKNVEPGEGNVVIVNRPAPSSP